MNQWIIPAMIGSFGTLLTLLLTSIYQRLGRIEDKVDGKMDKSDCEKIHRECQVRVDCDGLWDALGKHSHTGLPADSRVTR